MAAQSIADQIENHRGAYTAEELARLLNLSKPTIYRRIPGVRVGVCIRYSPRVVARWLRERGEI
jgi:excisionase family DNA binding protein